MTDKGYTARIGYNERDDILAGRIFRIRTIIGLHRETVVELRDPCL
jgi:predicted HicB family RNase H-like nuclease